MAIHRPFQQIAKWLLLATPFAVSMVLYLENAAILGRSLRTVHVMTDYVKESSAIPPPAWSCPPKEEIDITATDVETHEVKGHTPLIVFALPRTGSNLLNQLLGRAIALTADPKDYSMIGLNEMFMGNPSFGAEGAIEHTLEAMENSCEEVTEESVKEDRRRKVTEVFQQRFQDPKAVLRFLTRIPSRSQRPFYSVKVFSDHIATTNLTRQGFVESIDTVAAEEKKKPKYILLWRRRVLGSYVSGLIARNKGFFGVETGENDAVVVDKEDLEQSIEREYGYYKDLKAALDAASTDYMVLEYDRDMQEKQDKINTLKRLESFLGLKEDSIDLEQALSKVGAKKQSQVPLEKQVENWQEVVDWGYGGEVEDWPDIFA